MIAHKDNIIVAEHKMRDTEGIPMRHQDIPAHFYDAMGSTWLVVVVCAHVLAEIQGVLFLGFEPVAVETGARVQEDLGLVVDLAVVIDILITVLYLDISLLDNLLMIQQVHAPGLKQGMDAVVLAYEALDGPLVQVYRVDNLGVEDIDDVLTCGGIVYGYHYVGGTDHYDVDEMELFFYYVVGHVLLAERVYGDVHFGFGWVLGHDGHIAPAHAIAHHANRSVRTDC